MKLDFEIKELDLRGAGHGDVLIMSNGSKYLVVTDVDGVDYRAVDLETYRTTDYQCSIEELVDYELVGTVERIIKSENLVLGVR